MNATETRRAAIYCRLSLDRDGNGATVAEQERNARTLCELRGWEVADVYVDNSISASSGKVRPQYRAMLAALESGALDNGAIVATETTRLFRDTDDQERFIDAVRSRGRGVVLVETLSGGALDVHKAEGRGVARITGAVAVMESDKISERQQVRMARNAREGRPHGGIRAWGYRNVYALDASGKRTLVSVEIVEDEARHIRTAVDMILSGSSLRAACARITADGAVTPTGKTWKDSTLREMLTNARLAGLRSHRPEIARYKRADGKVVKVRGDAVESAAMWPGIITTDERTRLLARLVERAAIAQRRRDDAVNRSGQNGAGNHTSHLLTGLLYCGACGMKLVHRPASYRNVRAKDGTLLRRVQNQRASYACPDKVRGGCNGNSIVAENVEQYVIDRVGRFIAAPVANPSTMTDAVERLTAENTADHAQIANVQAALVNGVLMPEDASPVLASLRANIARRTAELESTAHSVDATARRATLAERWNDLDADERREVLRLALDSVVIHKSATCGRRTAAQLADSLRERISIATVADMADVQREVDERAETA